MNLLRDENLNWRQKCCEVCTDYDLLNESHKKYVMVSPNLSIYICRACNSTMYRHKYKQISIQISFGCLSIVDGASHACDLLME